jgi:hypothetical protein
MRKTLGAIGMQTSLKKQLVILIFLPVLAFGQAKSSNKSKNRPDSTEIKTSALKRIITCDTIKIIANSNGCFHSKRVFFYFFKSIDSYNVKCLRRDLYEIENPSCVHLDRLNLSDFAKLKETLIRGIKADTGQNLCTTSDDFTVSSKFGSVAFKDLRCSQTDDVFDFLEMLVQLKCDE